MTIIKVGHRAILRSEHGASFLTLDIVNEECEAKTTPIIAQSRLGQSLIGKQLNDTIEFATAGGKARYTITAIEPIPSTEMEPIPST